MAALLLGVNKGLVSMDASYDEQEQTIMMRNLLPGSQEFVEETYTGEDINIHAVYKAENGFVIETVTAGYADDIRMLVGVSNAGTVTGLVVRELSETAGLGGNALTDVDFLAQFLNTSGDVEIGTTADAWSGATGDTEAGNTEVGTAGEIEAGTTVDAMTGATVTSKAVARSVNSAVAYVTGADVTSSATSWGG